MPVMTAWGPIPDPPSMLRERPCWKCKGMVVWVGQPKHHPKCPHCGEAPLEHDIDRWQAVEAEYLYSRRPGEKKPARR